MATVNAASPSARLKKLFHALESARSLPRGEDLTFDPMMRLIGVSRPVLRDWCGEIDGFEASGCFERGGQGIEWAFNPVATIWFLIRHFEQERDRRSDRAMRMREIAGGESLAGVPADFDLDETRKMVDLSIKAQEMAEAQGRLIEAAPTANAFRQVMAEIQGAIMATPQEMDPTGKLDPTMREKLDEAARRSALRARDAGKAWLSLQRAEQSQPGEPAAAG